VNYKKKYKTLLKNKIAKKMSNPIIFFYKRNYKK